MARKITSIFPVGHTVPGNPAVSCAPQVPKSGWVASHPRLWVGLALVIWGGSAPLWTTGRALHSG
jgi:hypothetical protein